VLGEILVSSNSVPLRQGEQEAAASNLVLA